MKRIALLLLVVTAGCGPEDESPELVAVSRPLCLSTPTANVAAPVPRAR